MKKLLFFVCGLELYEGESVATPEPTVEQDSTSEGVTAEAPVVAWTPTRRAAT